MFSLSPCASQGSNDSPMYPTPLTHRQPSSATSYGPGADMDGSRGTPYGGSDYYQQLRAHSLLSDGAAFNAAAAAAAAAAAVNYPQSVGPIGGPTGGPGKLVKCSATLSGRSSAKTCVSRKLGVKVHVNSGV